MTDTVLLTDLQFDLDVPAFLRKLRIDQRPEYAERCTRLVAEGTRYARPKAAYRLAGVDADGDNRVEVDGVTLTSRVLRVNLGDTHRAFPFVATCGVEMEAWARGVEDMLDRFWADTLMEECVHAAYAAATADIARRFETGRTAIMNPGSLEDWPIQQQGELFRIMGDAPARIGVRLTESFLMVPMKSVSGLCFATDADYENCQLCPREACPNRRSPYDPHLYERRYAGRP